MPRTQSVCVDWSCGWQPPRRVYCVLRQDHASHESSGQQVSKRVESKVGLTHPGTCPEGGGRLYVEKLLPCHRDNGFKKGRGPAPSTLVDHRHIITLVPTRNACGKNQFSARISSDLGVTGKALKGGTEA